MKELNNIFFWALSEHQDITIFLFFFSSWAQAQGWFYKYKKQKQAPVLVMWRQLIMCPQAIGAVCTFRWTTHPAAQLSWLKLFIYRRSARELLFWWSYFLEVQLETRLGII